MKVSGNERWSKTEEGTKGRVGKMKEKEGGKSKIE